MALAPGSFLYLVAVVLTLLSGITSFCVSFWLPLREVWAGEIDE